MEKENQIMLVDEMQAKNKMFCSKNIESEEEKIDMFNALESCDVLLNDCVGQEILMKDVYVEEKQVIDDETGELKTKYRTIIFDTKGQTYATGSYGIFNVMKKLFMLYGLPTYEKGLKVKVIKRPIGNGKQSLSLSIIK